MAKPLTRISRVLVVGRVITSTFGLLLALALAGCEGPPPRSGVPVGGTAIAPSATGDGPAETAETQPPAEPDANAGVAAEPGQPSPPSPGPQAPATASEPSDSLAASVRDIAPAAGPAPTPAPAAPRKPAIDDDPDRLMGLGTVELTRMLGDPRFVRRDSSAQLWRYRNKSCILYLFLYRGAGRAEYFVSHIEARHGEGGAAEKRECFGALLLERREHEAGYDHRRRRRPSGADGAGPSSWAIIQVPC